MFQHVTEGEMNYLNQFIINFCDQILIVGDKVGRGGTVGRTVAATVDASAPGAGEEASLTLFVSLHLRCVFF